MNKAQMAEVVKMIQHAYPNATFGGDKLDQWYGWLKDFEFEQIEKNVKEHVLNSPYQPSIFDLVKSPKGGNSHRTLSEIEKADAEATAWLQKHGVIKRDK